MNRSKRLPANNPLCIAICTGSPADAFRVGSFSIAQHKHAPAIAMAPHGKELVAHEIHRRTRRKDKPFVRVNCASIPKDLYESEFFGHARGSFTGAVKDRAGRFEAAEGGTIFLDEIGEAPLDFQSKLLRVLQEKGPLEN